MSGGGGKVKKSWVKVAWGPGWGADGVDVKGPTVEPVKKT